MIPYGHDGTCANWGIADVLGETNTLFTHAINAIDSLIKGPLPNVEESVNRLNVASAFFGILYKQQKSGELYVFKGKDNLGKVREYYTKARSFMNAKRTDRWRLQCGDEDLEWKTTLGDLGYTKRNMMLQSIPDPTSLAKALQEDQSFQTKKKDISTYKGVFWSKYWSHKVGDLYPIDSQYFIGIGPDAEPKGSFFETTRSVGSTYTGGDTNSALAKEVLLLSKDFHSSRSLPQAEIDINSRHIRDIEDVQTRAGHLLHELMHMSTHKLEDSEIIEDWDAVGSDKVASTLEDCIGLGFEEFGNKAHLLITHAYSYQYFAEASYFEDINWWPEGWDFNIGDCPGDDDE
ncbi:hypothetical protein N7492_000917 [Penicillium capsulatum]|uniref:Uncharacterized protein n=1 Tax=Penicillium capsulatum TaxID=69766 RepID=A0A9W9IWS4_9EURO|nr:hypothetical protein N7492_000917 [Penicillium capsulatum]KAJ6130026.1 hypothetical protein N7512_002806 [Penicillium capsulatum]